MRWEEAVFAVDKINSHGYSDWRLPTTHEWFALTDAYIQHRDDGSDISNSYNAISNGKDSGCIPYLLDEPKGSASGVTRCTLYVRGGDAEEQKNQALKSAQEELNRPLIQQQRAQTYRATVEEFRKKIKMGTSTNLGLVIKIKGDLLLLQSYERKCILSNKYGNAAPLCYQWGPVVSAGTAWVKRSEVYPSQ